jgi:hypothetical protein
MGDAAPNAAFRMEVPDDAKKLEVLTPVFEALLYWVTVEDVRDRKEAEANWTEEKKMKTKREKTGLTVEALKAAEEWGYSRTISTVLMLPLSRKAKEGLLQLVHMSVHLRAEGE